MPFIISDVSYVDLNFCGTPKAIATGVYGGDAGVVIVDPGPGSCIDALRELLKAQGIGVGDIQAVLVTHIHLDHAGATGLLVEENPNIRVFVHGKGAPHMVDPSKLISSANQLWGEEGVARLWGKVVPVPQANLQILGEHDRIVAGGHAFDVRYTPGHASHHVSYFDEQTGIAWVGDTAGLRFGPTVFALAPTPPPDIDLDAWRTSVNTIRSWKPETVFITHFGPHAGVAEHLDRFEQGLFEVADMARRALEQDEPEDAKYARFKAELEEYVRRSVPAEETKPYEYVAPLDFNWRGLARYWRKRAGSAR